MDSPKVVDGMVTISEKEYESLKQDARFLEQLQDMGVDNWSGYDELDWEYIDGTTDEPKDY